MDNLVIGFKNTYKGPFFLALGSFQVYKQLRWFIPRFMFPIILQQFIQWDDDIVDDPILFRA